MSQTSPGPGVEALVSGRATFTAGSLDILLTTFPVPVRLALVIGLSIDCTASHHAPDQSRLDSSFDAGRTPCPLEHRHGSDIQAGAGMTGVTFIKLSSGDDLQKTRRIIEEPLAFHGGIGTTGGLGFYSCWSTAAGRLASSQPALATGGGRHFELGFWNRHRNQARYPGGEHSRASLGRTTARRFPPDLRVGTVAT